MNDKQADTDDQIVLRNAHLNKPAPTFPAIIFPTAAPSLTINFSSHGGQLYVENGTLKFMGSSGTITTLASA